MEFPKMEKLAVFKELYDFLVQNKKWWILPLFLFLLLLGVAIYLSDGTVIAPFVYTLF